MYICMVCYCVTAALYVRSVVMSLHTVTFDDDSKCPINYELSLFPKVFLKLEEMLREGNDKFGCGIVFLVM